MIVPGKALSRDDVADAGTRCCCPWGRRGRAAPVKPGAVACLCPHVLSACAMSTPVYDLEAEVLLLPPEDRARLLERLIASFEPRSSAQRAWLDLALRRRADVAAGTVAMLPGDEALARVRPRIA